MEKPKKKDTNQRDRIWRNGGRTMNISEAIIRARLVAHNSKSLKDKEALETVIDIAERIADEHIRS